MYRLLVLIIMSVGLLAGCSQVTVKVPPTSPQHFAVTASADGQADNRQQALAGFVQADFVETDGVRTSLGGARAGAETAHGADYLSESSGLWLLHLAYTEQFSEFTKFYAATKKKLYNGHNFAYRLDRPANKRANVNASVDDLRIMRALLAYAEASGTDHYAKEAATLYANWAVGCLPNGQLRDFYDVKSRAASQQASLAYFDLQTLKYFGGATKEYQQLVRVIQHGYLGDAVPLYASSYNWADAAYSDKALNTSEALETLLQLARIGKLREASRAWLVSRLAAKDLPNGIAINGGVTDAGQSIANWALAAQIFAVLQDREHYDQAMALVWAAQIKQGQLKGGFGVAKTGAAFSYNNLNALIAADVRGQAHAAD